MKCNYCGTENVELAAVCEKCGAPLNQPAQPPKAKSGGFGGKNLLLIMVGVALLVMILGHISLMNTAIEDIRPIAILLEMSGEQDAVEELKDEVDDYADELEDEFDRYEDELEDELGSKAVKLTGNVLKAVEKCADKLSINNFKSLISACTKLVEAGVDELDVLGDELDEFRAMEQLLNGFSVGLLIASLLSLLFTVIGGLTKKSGLVIAGMVFSTLFCLALYGVLFIILNVAVHVVMIKLINDSKKTV